jgi:transcriptional regulator with XRE-family HTH domain
MFAHWLQTQLLITGMSRRQLAQRSGIDHSTISRLLLGQRMPSLETATKLARVLPELQHQFAEISGINPGTRRTTSPAARMEYALRSDESLTQKDVKSVMEFYLALRARATARANPTDEESRPIVRRLLGRSGDEVIRDRAVAEHRTVPIVFVARRSPSRTIVGGVLPARGTPR